ncbi:recombination-related endonuclease [Providencia phage PSTRCR_121]|nr:recombination-related endonuclease [Providencia phage PSTRCR_121]
MKILFMGDLHYGVAQDDPWIQNIQRDSVRQVIELCKKRKIKTVIQFGDWFDVRKAVTHTTMEFTREMVEMFKEADIKIVTLVGNHDQHFRNKIHPNAATELLTQHDNITVIDKPTTLDFDGCLVDIVPWLCQENTEEILNHVKTSSAEICIGHWELNGFYFYKGMKSHGLEPDFLKKYKKVYSGHFHTISKAGNVEYIGTPYSITAGDEDDPRGVWIFDTKTHKTEFVQNETMWHKKVFYPGQINFDDYKNLAVRLVVNKIDDKLTEFESNLERVVHSLRVLSNGTIDGPEIDDDSEVEVESLDDLIKSYIYAIDGLSEEECDKVYQYALSLKVEASSL